MPENLINVDSLQSTNLALRYSHPPRPKTYLSRFAWFFLIALAVTGCRTTVSSGQRRPCALLLLESCVQKLRQPTDDYSVLPNCQRYDDTLSCDPFIQMVWLRDDISHSVTGGGSLSYSTVAQGRSNIDCHASRPTLVRQGRTPQIQWTMHVTRRFIAGC
jgi:hypothetical protein